MFYYGFGPTMTTLFMQISYQHRHHVQTADAGVASAQDVMHWIVENSATVRFGGPGLKKKACIHRTCQDHGISIGTKYSTHTCHVYVICITLIMKS